jgi:hypothetical protein
MSRSLRASLSWCLVSSLALACGDPDPVTPADGGVTTDAPTPRVDSGMRTDGGTTPAGNDSFETATSIVIDAEGGTEESIERAGDVDYFRVELTEGQWLGIETWADPESDPWVDTFVTLYDASMTQIAQNGNGVLWGGTNSEITYRVGATGTYYVKVEDYSTVAPDEFPEGPEGGPTYGYTLYVFEYSGDVTGVTIDDERGDDATTASALRFNNGFSYGMGRLDDATDVDVFSFPNTSSASAPQSMFVEVVPSGPEGYGSPRSAGRVWITNMAGEVLVRATIGETLRGVNPGLTVMGPHFLWIEAAGGTPGPNDHYAVRLWYASYSENVPEGSAANDTLATAESVTLAPIDDTMPDAGEAHYLLARVGATDVDYFGFDVVAGRTVSIACRSRNSGSGVIDLRVELRDSADAVLASDVETIDGQNAFIDAFAVTGAGRYYARLSSAGQDPEVLGDFVRCGISARPPE